MANGVTSEKQQVPEVSPEELTQKIIYQVEFYFGDYNLPRDKFMQGKIKENNDGWVELDTLLTFNRLKNLSSDKEIITAAVKTSTNDIVQVSEDNLKIRRNPSKPLPESFKTEFIDRTVYVKGFPRDTTLDQLIDFFKVHKAGCVKMRRFSFNKQFKGSVFVLFETTEAAKTFRELKDVKYESMELILMMAQEHADKKTAEKKLSKENKDKKKRAREDDDDDEDKDELGDMAKAEEFFQKMDKKKGVFLRLTGIPKEGGDIDFPDLKKVFVDEKFNVGFVEFNKGDEEATVRFNDENAAKEAFEKLAKESKITIKEKELVAKVLEGDEETAFYRTQAERKVQKFNHDRNNRKRGGQNRQQGYRGSGGRGGGRHHGGRGGGRRGGGRDGGRDGGGPHKRARTDA